MNPADRIKEIKQDMKRFKLMLKEDKPDFTTQTWIELQLKEYRKELKSLKQKP